VATETAPSSGTPSASVKPRSSGGGRVRTGRRSSRTAGGLQLLYLLPAVALLVGVVAIPTGIAFTHAFTDWHPGGSSPWIGLKNFWTFVHFPQTPGLLKNTGYYLLGLPLWTAIPLILAFVLHERVSERVASVFRSIFLFPAVLSPAIVGIMFVSFLKPDGIVNRTLDGIGLGFLQQRWIDDPNWVKATIIVVLAWSGMGVGLLIFTSALAALPHERVEAAQTDGASWLQCAWHVMLPGIAPMVLLYACYLLVCVFLYMFGTVYTLTQGGPGYSSSTMDYEIYVNGLEYGQFGIAAAQSVFLSVAAVLFIAFAFVLSRRLTRRLT
jgi:ABC-type sugar transport system permease subunit